MGAIRSGVVLGCQGGCERRIEIFVIIPKKKSEGWGRVGSAGGGGGCRVGGGQGECD